MLFKNSARFRVWLNAVAIFAYLNIFAADIYVDQSAPSGGDGTSWATAFQDIESAIAVANANDIIYIAEGVYQPQNEMDITIPLTLRGGYPSGGGTRNSNAHVTQIQADFNPSNIVLQIFDIANNADFAISGVRFYNVRTAIQTDSNLQVSDVTFEGSLLNDINLGNINSCTVENSLFSNHSGNAIVTNNSIVTNISISNTIFQNGTERAVLLGDEVANFSLTDCIIRDYNAPTRNIFTARGDGIISNVTVTNNICASVISLSEGIVDIDNFTAYEGKSAIIAHRTGGTVNLKNSTFRDNNDPAVTCIASVQATLTIDQCIFENNSGDGGPTILNSSRSNTTITNSKFLNNSATGSFNNSVFDFTGDENVDILVTIDNCEFKDNVCTYAALEIEYYLDLVLRNCLFENNGGTNSGDLDLWYLDSALITNNTFKNNSSNKPAIDIGVMNVNAAVIDDNTFINNNGRDINIDRVDDITISNNRYYGENIFLEFDRVPLATMTNEYLEGNSSGSRFIILDDTDITFVNSTIISSMVNGDHRLINSSTDVSLNIVNSTFSARDFNNTNVSVGFNANLASTLRNSIIWSGNNLSQSGFHGNTSNLTVRNSLIKGENPAGASNLNGNQAANAPIFINPANSDFRTQRCSPTVNLGNNSFISETTDLNGNPRIFQSTVDMGAYELQSNKNTTCQTPAIPPCVTLTNPTNGQNNVPSNTTISWNTASRADGYVVSLGTSPGIYDIIAGETILTGTSYDFPGDFPEGQTIYVAITPFNETGQASGCVEQNFTIVSSTSGGSVPSCGAMSAPANGTTNVDVATDISWAPVSNADGYLLSIGTTSGGTDIRNRFDVGNATVHDLPTDLPPNTEIFVTVFPYNTSGTATACSERSFVTGNSRTTVPSSCANLVSPANGATDVAVDLTSISWDAVSDATGYRVTINGSTSDTNDITDQNITGTSYNFSNNFDNGESVTVTIIPFNAVGDAVGCTTQSFTIVAATPTVPGSCANLVSPANGATDVAVDLASISWDAVSDATGYRVTINGSTSNINDITDQNITGTSYNFTNDFDNSETVTITIIPFNAVGDAVGCTTQSFTIVAATPTVPGSCANLVSPANGATNVVVNLANISWDAVSDATGYRVTINGSISDTNDITDQNITGTSYNFSNNFDNGETVTVTIIPFNAVGDAVGCTTQSFTIVAATPTVPGSCANLVSPANGATNVAVDLASISWNAVSDATGYRLTINGSTSDTNNITDQNITGTSYNFSNNFDNGETVTVTIIPFNAVGDAVGCTTQSFTITATSGTVPNCSNLTTDLNNAINVPVDANITWNAVANADGYRLTIGTSTGASDILNNANVGDITSYNPTTNLPENTQIFVTVIPFNSSGDALSCSEESFTTESITSIPNCTALFLPANNAVDVSVSTDLSWVFIGNSDGYRLTVGTTSGGSDILNNVNVGNITTYDLPTDLPENTEIFVTIIPYNSAGDATGCSEYSFTTESIASIPDCTSLTMPLDGAVDVPISTDFSWSEIANANGYRLRVGTTSGGTDILNNFDVGSFNTYNLIGDLPLGSEIFVTIIPYNGLGEASGCIEESFTTVAAANVPDCTTLTLPLNGATNVDVNTNLEWNAPPTATGYFIGVGTAPGVNNIFGANYNTPSIDPPVVLPAGQVIYVTIVPYNDEGEAVGCTFESFTTAGGNPPPACTTLASPANGASNVAVDLAEISWNAVSDATGYRVTINGSTSNTNDITDQNITGTSYNFSNNFDNGETVTVTIIPFNAVGDAIGCTTQSFTIIAATPTVPGSCANLVSPANGATNVAVDLANISWDAVSDATGYRVTINGSTSDINDIADQNITGTSYNFSNNFDNGETVTVTIIPFNAVGDAIGCTTQSFTIVAATPTVPSSCANLVSPANGAANVAVDLDNISWRAVSDATGYRLTINGSTSDLNDITDQNITGTSYNFSNNFNNGETVTVTIIPFNAAGDAVGCTTQSFTIEESLFEEDETKYGFSPDGDGINEFWKIVNIERYPNNTVSIYNRWGNKVFEISGYNNTSRVFNGSANRLQGLGAKELPSGTYFFKIEIEGNHSIKKLEGFIVLKR